MSPKRKRQKCIELKIGPAFSFFLNFFGQHQGVKFLSSEMGKFSLEQRWEILKCYFQSNCCIAETVRRLEKSFGKGNAPTLAGVRKFVQKVRETGMLVDYKNYPRTCPSRSAETIVAVAKSIERNPKASLRERAEELCISRTTLRRILNDLGVKAHKTQPRIKSYRTENDKDLGDEYSEVEMLEEGLEDDLDLECDGFEESLKDIDEIQIKSSPPHV